MFMIMLRRTRLPSEHITLFKAPATDKRISMVESEILRTVAGPPSAFYFRLAVLFLFPQFRFSFYPLPQITTAMTTTKFSSFDRLPNVYPFSHRSSPCPRIFAVSALRDIRGCSYRRIYKKAIGRGQRESADLLASVDGVFRNEHSVLVDVAPCESAATHFRDVRESFVDRRYTRITLQ